MPLLLAFHNQHAIEPAVGAINAMRHIDGRIFFSKIDTPFITITFDVNCRRGRLTRSNLDHGQGRCALGGFVIRDKTHEELGRRAPLF